MESLYERSLADPNTPGLKTTYRLHQSLDAQRIGPALF
jgi:hypothetical protein